MWNDMQLQLWNEFLEKELWDWSTYASVILIDTAKLSVPCGRHSNGPQRCPNPNSLKWVHHEMDFADVLKSSQGDHPQLSRWVNGIPRFLVRGRRFRVREREDPAFEDRRWVHEPKNIGSLQELLIKRRILSWSL